MNRNYQLEVERDKMVESLHVEYLSLLAILYGDQLESGTQLLKDYGHLTMIDIENELQLRTLMYRARRLRKRRQLLDEYEANERDMLEQLKNIT